MAKRAGKNNKALLEQDTTAKLIDAATQIFSQKGFDGTTVKEIASQAGVNISLISYHFQGKEGLFRKCVESFGESRLREAEQILTTPESEADLKVKLKLWIQQFLLCHIEDDRVCKILLREDFMQHKFMKEIFENTFLKAFESMVRFLQSAKKNQIIKKEIDPLLASGMIYGALIHMGRTQSIQENQFGISIRNEKYRTQTIDHFVAILLNGIT